MFFFNKNKMKKTFDQSILVSLQQMKSQWLANKELLSNSYEPSEHLINETKMLEIKYLYYLKEAKYRKISL